MQSPTGQPRMQFDVRFLLALVAVVAAGFAGWRIMDAAVDRVGAPYAVALLLIWPVALPYWIVGLDVRKLWRGWLVGAPVCGAAAGAMVYFVRPTLALALFAALWVMAVWMHLAVGALRRRTTIGAMMFALGGGVWWGATLEVFALIGQAV